jgi:chromosome segregation ATPase
MHIGFRKSLFGFNCDDVIKYVEKTHSTFKSKSDELTRQTNELSAQLNLTKDAYDKLLAEKNQISEQLNAFTEKAAEIERLSESIGKLYLVSQVNAQAIINQAEESRELAKCEIEKNLSAIDDAHTSLNALREGLVKTSDNFIKEVESMLSSLDMTRQQITENSKVADEKIEDFETVYDDIVNE